MPKQSKKSPAKSTAKKTSKRTKDLFVSVILLADKSTTQLAKHITKVSELLQVSYDNYEIIVIDNFVNIAELTAAGDLLPVLPCIRIIKLSKVVTKDTAVFAGIEAAIGDRVVLLVPGYDPIKLIPTFVEKNADADIVFGVSKTSTRSGLLNKYGAEFFYWYNKKYLNISIPAKSTYFMAMNRRAVNALTRSGRHAKHIRYLARQVGYHMDEYRYTPNPRVSPDKKSFKELFMSAVELTTNYSQHPLRLVTWLGTVAALVNLVYCVYVVAVRIFKKDVAQGWTTLSLQSAFMFLFVFLILAVLSEYIGQVLQESRHEPPYHVMDELSSTISVADMTRRNIMH